MKKTAIAGLLAVLVIAFAFGYRTLQKFKIELPAYEPPREIVLLNQNWTPAQRLRFHHTAQGTRLIPYSWFMAIEQPCFSLRACEPFSDTKYLGRFGFLPSTVDPELNPDGLPVGFALQKDFFDPINQRTYPVAGLTCAACHTGQLNFDKYSVRIEGGPAMIEAVAFEKAVGEAVAFTKLFPFRYGRFERKVLGPNATDEQRSELKKAFNYFLDAGKAEKSATDKQKIYDNPVGFARTDALTRIGNQVFAIDMQIDANFAPANAPVRFPQLWDASWFNWVQYNSSIADPLVRNIGESIGVRAVVKLYGGDAGRYLNSVNMEGLRTVESLLAGPAPFKGLGSPKWPHVFPKLDSAKIARGKVLYVDQCQGCHLPAKDELLADLKSPSPQYWWENSQHKRFLTMHDVEVDYVGTDAHEARDFIDRTADTGALQKGRVSAAVGLALITTNIRDNFFKKANLTPQQQSEWMDFHDPNDPPVRARPIYKARPLDGIWAVAPYLHNGSVPNLYELLSPLSERSKSFWLGTKNFDPVKIGYETGEIKGGYHFDVTRIGNANGGHEFKDGPRGKGVIGPALPPADRWAIIEYLKSL